MTRARRRSTKRNSLSKNEDQLPPSRENTPSASDGEAEKEVCPACSADSTENRRAFVKENWILCDLCKTWYHWRCAGSSEDVETVDKWSAKLLFYSSNLPILTHPGRYCKACLGSDPTLSVTFKAPTRKSGRKRTQRDYGNLNSGQDTDSNRWLRVLEQKDIKNAPFKRMEGSSVGLQWLEDDNEAMTEPIVIERPEGLGMKMPSRDFTVDDVAELVGEDTPLEVIGTSLAFKLSSTFLSWSRRCHAIHLPWLDIGQMG